MKKLLLTLFIAAAATTAGMAQKADDPNETRVEQEKQLRDELKMTHQQTPKYYALNKEYFSKINAIQNDANLDKATKREKELALKKEQEAKLFELLNPEQEARYKQISGRDKTEVVEKGKATSGSGS